MTDLKLKKYIDYAAMYDVAVMEPYMMSFKKLADIVGTSENLILMAEEAEKNVGIENFNYKGRIVTYHNASEIEKVGKRIFSFLENDEKWSSLVKKIKEYQNELEPVMSVKQTENIITDAQDKNVYLKIYEKYYNLYLDIITTYLITDGRYHEFSVSEMKSHKINQDVINRLSTSDKQSSFQKANHELNEIGKLYRAQKSWQTEFDNFIDKYIWFYLADTHYDFNQIVDELKIKLSVPQPVPDQVKESIHDIELNPTDRKILDRIAELGFQRMELRRYWQWIDYTLHTLLYTFALRNGLPEKTLVFLSDSEVRSILSEKTEATLKNALTKAKKRVTNFAILLDDGEISIFDSQSEIQETRRKFVSEEKFTDSIKGNVSYRSDEQPKVIGTARVITWSKNISDELTKIVDGEILVVTQTKPDFLPYMKRIKAIVADEGGITSHVSVLSRELKIPAIVGTRIATDSIKTGDCLELDMNKGEIVIIH